MEVLLLWDVLDILICYDFFGSLVGLREDG